MSRTKKGSKGISYDYWGRRPLSGDCGYGPEVKRITHRLERAQAKQGLLKEPTEPEWDEQEYVPSERYMLCVEQGPHSDLFIHSDDKDTLKLAAHPHLKSGRQCFIYDNETGEQVDLSLKERV